MDSSCEPIHDSMAVEGLNKYAIVAAIRRTKVRRRKSRQDVEGSWGQSPVRRGKFSADDSGARARVAHGVIPSTCHDTPGAEFVTQSIRLERKCAFHRYGWFGLPEVSAFGSFNSFTSPFL